MSRLIALFAFTLIVVLVLSTPVQNAELGPGSGTVKSEADATVKAQKHSAANARSESGSGSVARSGAKADNHGLANAAAKADDDSSANALAKSNGKSHGNGNDHSTTAKPTEPPAIIPL